MKKRLRKEEITQSNYHSDVAFSDTDHSFFSQFTWPKRSKEILTGEEKEHLKGELEIYFAEKEKQLNAKEEGADKAYDIKRYKKNKKKFENKIKKNKPKFWNNYDEELQSKFSDYDLVIADKIAAIILSMDSTNELIKDELDIVISEIQTAITKADSDIGSAKEILTDAQTHLTQAESSKQSAEATLEGYTTTLRNPILEQYDKVINNYKACLLYTSPSPRDLSTSRMPSSA